MNQKIVVFINKQKHELSTPTATGAQLKELAGIPHTDVLFKDLPGDDEVIPNDQTVTLKNGDHFHSAPPANYGEQKGEKGKEHDEHGDDGEGRSGVTVLINRKPYEFTDKVVIGADLKRRAGIPQGDVLFKDQPGEDEVITNEMKVKLKKGDCFHSAPPANYGDGWDVGGLVPKRAEKQPNGWTHVVFDMDFPGFRPAKGEVLVKLPPLFPTAQPDMFWVRPALVTASGATPHKASGETINGEAWQRYSWHLAPGAWKPGVSDLKDFIRCIRARFARGN